MGDSFNFHIPADAEYICIGPIESAISGCLAMERGDPAPTCWNEPPSASVGGTVLVHDVDFRLPALSGAWTAGRLLNSRGEVCGGMVWHESVDVSAGAAGSSSSNAAKLLFEMENAGARVICNEENEAVLAQGIRFVGRYSWPEQKRAERTDPVWEHAEDFFGLMRGPSCYFMPADIVRNNVIPDFQERVATQNAIIMEKVRQKMASGGGQKERYPNEFRDSFMYGEKDEQIQALMLPSFKNYNNAGVGFCFSDHEYLFGRLWMTEGKLTGTGKGAIAVAPKCRAFCFYTYASPDHFAEIRVEDSAVCPALLPFIQQHQEEQKSRQGATTSFSGHQSLKDVLLAHCADTSSADSDIATLLNDMTRPFREDFITFCTQKNTDLAIRLVSTPGLLSIDASLFSLIVRRFRFERVNEQLISAVIDNTSDEVLQNVASKDIACFQALDRDLLNGTYPFNRIDVRTAEDARGSHLGFHLERPGILEKMLLRGVPAKRMLAESEHGVWFHTALSEAALQGNLPAVQLLIEAGADVDESVGGDPWNAIVYAAAGGNEEVLEYLRQRFPAHFVWKRRNIPLEMKKLPEFNIFGDANTADDEDEEDDGADGADEAHPGKTKTAETGPWARSGTKKKAERAAEDAVVPSSARREGSLQDVSQFALQVREEEEKSRPQNVFMFGQGFGGNKN